MDANTFTALLVIAALGLGAGSFYMFIHRPRMRKLKELTQRYIIEILCPDEGMNEVKYLRRLKGFYTMDLKGRASYFDLNAKTYLKKILSADISRINAIYMDYKAYQDGAVKDIFIDTFADMRAEIISFLTQEFRQATGKRYGEFIDKVKSPLFLRCGLVHYFLEYKGV